MKFVTSEVYNAAVISIKGKLMGGPEAADLHQKIAAYLNEGKKNIIIELSDVKFVNSSGIGNIVRAYSSVKDGGGKLKLAGVGNKVEGVLSITKLLSIFELYDNVEEAAKSF
jgi:anti-sigma B factor antagonist